MRVPIALALSLILGVACSSERAALQSASQEKPNIVFILTDDQPESTLTRMPEVERNLVEGGRTLENTVNTFPLCCPSRATIFRGKYPHNTNVWDNALPRGGYPVFAAGAGSATYATALDGVGYQTGYYGRYMHTFSGASIPPGWDAFYGEVMEDVVSESVGPPESRVFVRADGVKAPLPLSEGETQDTVVARKALGFVERNAPKETPFLLSVGFEAPHAPAYHERAYNERFPNARVPRSEAYLEDDISDKPGWIRSKPPLSGQQNPRVSPYCKA